MDKKIHYKRITLYGLVQGIGFRPYVARLAMKWGIEGEVCNLGGAVRILASAPAAFLEGFLAELEETPPPLSEILYKKVEEMSPTALERESSDGSGKPAPNAGFQIVESREELEAPVMLPADLPVCEACLTEMRDPQNRRYQHLLISCTHCGPRYSIIEKSPYDRVNTTMADFEFCPQCYEEYTTSESRRFHAQTVSCHQCGPRVQLTVLQDNLGRQRIYHGEEGFEKTAELLREGHILAVKGIGGYHFLASPYSDETVRALRQLKHREEKPFALCFPSLEAIKTHAEVSKEEETLLLSKARPIVLLEQKQSSGAFSPVVLMHSRYIGAFLPYTPILVRLSERLGPLIATSANLSDAPIIHREADIQTYPGLPFAGIFSHNREIDVSQDDSVAWVVHGKPQLIRRSRGYTPLPVYIKAFEDHQGPSVLATGGELKSAFCLQKGPLAYISQYLGDLGSPSSLELYRENLGHLKTLLSMAPELVACDLHPDYATTRLAFELGLPVIRVQHHHAHIASVMAEKGLESPVIGMSFDGTGYGADGTLWGGEFLVCEKGSFTRAACLKPIPLLMGDDSTKDCLKTATAYLYAYGLREAISDDRYPIISRALDHQVNTLLSSSVGRLFDAVSSILGLCYYNAYEGEAAILLENAAFRAFKDFKEHDLNAPSFDIIEEKNLLMLDVGPFLKALAEAKAEETLVRRSESWALAFHQALTTGVVAILDRLVEKTGIKDIVLSGGVFQNKILTENILSKLEERGYRGHMASLVPPNDGGISLGQAYIALKQWNEMQ